MDQVISRSRTWNANLTWLRYVAWSLVVLFSYELIVTILFYGLYSLESHQVMPYANPWNSTVKNGMGIVGVVRDEFDWRQAEFSTWLPWISCVTVSIMGIAVAGRIVNGYPRVVLTLLLVAICLANIFVPLMWIVSSQKGITTGILHMAVLTIAVVATSAIQFIPFYVARRSKLELG